MHTGVLVGVTSVFGEPVVDVVGSGAPVFGTADVDPQAITASMIAKQDVIRAL